jgi:hypothetical protein
MGQSGSSFGAAQERIMESTDERALKETDTTSSRNHSTASSYAPAWNRLFGILFFHFIFSLLFALLFFVCLLKFVCYFGVVARLGWHYWHIVYRVQVAHKLWGVGVFGIGAYLR